MPGARRNVLLVTVDQWRGDCLSAAGHPTVRTPHLDLLARSGTLFSRHFAQAAPCGPSRASLLTGLYPHTHRSVLNGTPLDARFTNVAIEARAAGYDPVLFGYTDQSADPRALPSDDPRLRTYEGVLPGFRPVVHLPEHLGPWAAWLSRLGYDVPSDARRIYEPVSDAPGAPPPYRAEHTEAAFLTGEILRWLRDRAPDAWFVHAAYIRPHPPFVVPEPYNRMFDPSDVPPPRRSRDGEEEAALHPFLAAALAVPGLRAPAAESAVRRMRATYYGMMAEVDHQIGRLLSGLAERDDWDRTLVIVTSDHGEMLGDRWLTEKLGWFDESYHIPLVVRDPRPEADATRGLVVGSPTENVDVVPTILEWIGAEVPPHLDGASLLPLTAGAAPDGWRTAVHWEFDFRDPVTRLPEQVLGLAPEECCLTVRRDEAGKYVHFAGLEPLFFDLVADPDERVNRAPDPGYAATVLRYAQGMMSWRMRHDDRGLTDLLLTADGVHDGRPR